MGACDPEADVTDSPRPSTLGSTPTVTTSTTPPAAGTGIPAGDDRIVERVVDGDTLKLTDTTRVRLIGVDTPETVDPRKPVQCFGKEASAYVAGLLPAGTPVRLVYDVQRLDRYGRTLAYVYRLPDGLFVNAQLAAEGYASPLTIPPDVAHADLFAGLAAAAREARKGLWGAC